MPLYLERFSRRTAEMDSFSAAAMSASLFSSSGVFVDQVRKAGGAASSDLARVDRVKGR